MLSDITLLVVLNLIFGHLKGFLIFQLVANNFVNYFWILIGVDESTPRHLSIHGVDDNYIDFIFSIYRFTGLLTLSPFTIIHFFRKILHFSPKFKEIEKIQHF